MYRLYSAPTGYAMGAHCLLEELGVEYEIRQVRLYTEPADPEFRRVSPHCRVPVLVDGDEAVYESGAIAMYLAEKHPDAGFRIPEGHPQRGRFLQWMFYLASTLQPDVIIEAHPEFYSETPSHQRKIHDSSLRRLHSVLSNINRALSPGPYFFGNQITACDFCLGIQGIWPEIYASGIGEFPNLKHMSEHFVQRAAVAKVLGWHDQEAIRLAAEKPY